VPANDPPVTGPGGVRGQGKALFPERQRPAAQLARQPAPVDQGQDDGDAKVDPQPGPTERHHGGQGHPEGNLRHGHDHFGEALHQVVHDAAIVARRDSQDRAERDTQEHAQQADRQRHLGAEHTPRKEVAALVVRPEDNDGRAIKRAVQVHVPLGEPKERLVLRALREPVHRVLHCRVRRVVDLERLGIHHLCKAVDEGTEAPVALRVHKAHRHGRRIDGVRETGGQVIRGDEIAKEGDSVKDQQDHAADHGRAVAPEPPPDELPLAERGPLDVADLFGQVLGSRRHQAGLVPGLGRAGRNHQRASVLSRT